MSTTLFERYEKLETFTFQGRPFNVRLTGSMAVAEGVVCDTYDFEGDKTRDLGIIKVEQGFATPRQRVLAGEHTIEGYLDGAGTLEVVPVGIGVPEEYLVYGSIGYFDRGVRIGDILQWSANHDSPLVAFEVCYPPYEEGRFENIG